MKAVLSRIRNKLLIAFAAVATLPLVIVAIYGTGRTLEILDQSALDQAADQTQLAARRIDGNLAAAQTEIRDLGRDPSLLALIASPDPSLEGGQLIRKAQDQFLVRLRSRPVYRRLTYADREGRVVIRLENSGDGPAAVTPESGESVRDKPFFLETANLLQAQVGMTLEQDPGEITYSTGVYLERYQDRGAIALTLSIPTLLEDAGLEPDGNRTVLLDREGKPLWTSALGAPRSTERDRTSILGGALRAFHLPGGPILSHARLSPSHGDPEAWILVRQQPEADLSEPIDKFREVFSIVLVGALLLALLLSLALSRQLLGPLNTLKEGAQRMAAGDLKTKLDVRSEDEIQELAGEFNTMAEQLRELTGGLERKVEEKVAEREQLEMQLLQSERLSSIGLLAAGVAHEIRNPLATISMYAQMLHEKAAGEEQKERLQVILEHIERISLITRGLLDFSRQTDGESAPVDLHETLDSTLRLIAPELDRHHVKAEVDREANLPHLWGQSTQLQQAFLNILMNSSQAMPDGGILKVSTRRLQAERMAEVRFEDTGPGIDAEDLGRVFDPFFTTKEPGDGTGLGLAVTYGIVQSHGGFIEVESRPGEGTRVTIRLPLAKGEKD